MKAKFFALLTLQSYTCLKTKFSGLAPKCAHNYSLAVIMFILKENPIKFIETYFPVNTHRCAG